MTAREKLMRIMQRRKWYAGYIPADAARSLKRQVMKDESVTNDKIRETLFKLGHKPKQEEKW